MAQPGGSSITQSAVLTTDLELLWARLRTAQFATLFPAEVAKVSVTRGAAPDQVGAVLTVTFTTGFEWTLRVRDLSESRRQVAWELVSAFPPVPYSSRVDVVTLTPVSFADTAESLCEWTVYFSSDADEDTRVDVGETILHRFKQVRGERATPLSPTSVSAPPSQQAAAGDVDVPMTVAEVPLPANCVPISPTDYDALFNLLWPTNVGDANLARVLHVWHEQRFQWLDTETQRSIGFFQPRNGPCGVLAAVLAEMIVYLLFRRTGVTEADIANPTPELRTEALAQALTAVIWRAAAGHAAGVWRSPDPSVPRRAMVIVPLPEEPSGVGGDSSARPVLARTASTFADPYAAPGALLQYCFESEAALHEFVTENIGMFQSGSGVVYLLYSMLMSRGLDNVRADMRDETIAHLIYEDACSEQNVVNLMLTGVAANSVSDELWVNWESHVNVGFLTCETRFTVGRHFTRPEYPVYVVLGGGHYTTLWTADTTLLLQPALLPLQDAAGAPVATPVVSTGPVMCAGNCGFFGDPGRYNLCSQCHKNPTIREQAETAAAIAAVAAASAALAAAPATAAPSVEETKTVTMWHFNGLLHGGERVRLARFSLAVYGAWPDGHGQDSSQDAIGEVIATARKIQKIVDTRPLPGGTRQEGPWEFLVTCNPDGSMETGGSPPPGEKWRCRDCHLQEPPVYRAFNAADATVCCVCNKAVAVCGFCHWLRAEQLTQAKLRSWQRDHAPPILVAIRTEWPRADVRFTDGVVPAMWG